MSAVCLTAQPTLTFPLTDELLSLTPTFNVSNGVPEGPAGANQFWDFSNLGVNQSITGGFDLPQNTPFAADYPEADIVGVIPDPAGTNYLYYDFTSDGVYTLGLEIQGSGSQPYSDSRQDLITPMSYLDTYTDMAVFTNNSGGFITEGESDFVAEVDAYGTIVTPGGTFNNVLRIHTVENTQTSLDFGIGEPFVTNSVIESFAWVVDGLPLPIFLTGTQSLEGVEVGNFSRFISDIPLSITNFNNLKGVSLYPVPAVDFITLDLGSNSTGQAVLRIYDVRGAMIKEYNQEVAKETRFDISDLPSGFFSINIQTEEGMATKHFTK